MLRKVISMVIFESRQGTKIVIWHALHCALKTLEILRFRVPIKRYKCVFWLIFIGFNSVWWTSNIDLLHGHQTLRFARFCGFVRRAPNVTFTVVWWTNRISQGVSREQNRAETIIFKAFGQCLEKLPRGWFWRLAKGRNSWFDTRRILL